MLLGLAAMLAATASTSLAQGAGGRCDRACLTSVAEAYVAALVAHDPKRVALAADIVTVENAKRIKPGEGAWASLSGGPTAFRIVVPDVTAQQVAYLAVLQEGGKPIELGLRLKVAGGKVVEAEHLIAHQLLDAGLKNLGTVRTAFARDVPDPYRDSRGRLLEIARSYYDALDENNGRLAPFGDDCVRRENGLQTARNPVPDDPKPGIGYLGSLGCAAQLDTGAFLYITKIDDRRVLVADEQTGVAVGWSHFHHAQQTKDFPVWGVPWETSRRVANEPFDLPAMHIYKIRSGKIHEIEAIGFTTGYDVPTGWEK